ncbi:hypothetical protein HHI36_016848 [Cryptolaemus montrouzieri]|uniref:Endonuclease/exonuclease/phosphatase domain-containing protein n=1 Tax=Cryptolaemus montrouzieri TaxID=559131 RepID=A0ABD2NLY1_9CUCU
MRKRNAPRINNPLNDSIHFIIPIENDELHIFLIYNHPTSYLEETILNMAVNYKYSLIIGDFNINNSKKRRNLNNFLQRSSFSMAETPPTFIMPNNEDTTPDLILFSPNMKNFIENIDVIPDLGSEHLSIILSLNVDITMKLDKFYCFRKANMENINKRLENYININRLVPISPNTISDFLKTLEETVLDNTPKTTRTYGTMNFHHLLLA